MIKTDTFFNRVSHGHFSIWFTSPQQIEPLHKYFTGLPDSLINKALRCYLLTLITMVTKISQGMKKKLINIKIIALNGFQNNESIILPEY